MCTALRETRAPPKPGPWRKDWPRTRLRCVTKILMPRPSNASNRMSSTRWAAASPPSTSGPCASAATSRRACKEAATIIGTTRKTSPDLAAFANGAAGRYYDLNDIYVGRLPAIRATISPRALRSPKPNARVAATSSLAIALAYEIDCRLVDALDLFARGWDTPVFSLPAVALAAGKLMKLDAAKLTEAVNLAINDHIAMGQTRAQVLSDWKGLADGEASRNAVFAAILARGGLTGPAPIFEGQQGFFRQVSGDATY